jgi:hypothetical protein
MIRSRIVSVSYRGRQVSANAACCWPGMLTSQGWQVIVTSLWTTRSGWVCIKVITSLSLRVED